MGAGPSPHTFGPRPSPKGQDPLAASILHSEVCRALYSTDLSLVPATNAEPHAARLFAPGILLGCFLAPLLVCKLLLMPKSTFYRNVAVQGQGVL